MLAHLLTDNTLHHLSVQNPVLFNTVNMRNTDILLPVGVVLYCQTGSSFFQVFQVYYRLIGLTNK